MNTMDIKNITVPQNSLKTLREITVCYLGFFLNLKQWRGSSFYLKEFLSKDGSGLYRAVISDSYKFLLLHVI